MNADKNRVVSEVDPRIPSLLHSIRDVFSGPLHCACIAGSGIYSALSNLPRLASIPYSSLKGMPRSGVAGHSNCLDVVSITERNVLVFLGRFHLYEGYAIDDVILPVRIAAGLGIRNIICTNAAGGLRQDWKASDIMLADALLNHSGRSVFFGDSRKATQRDVLGTSLSVPDGEWTSQVRKELSHYDWFHCGRYCSVSGPSYETRSEIAMFSTFADAIGMSTVHEMQVAARLGMRSLALSVITNCLPPPAEVVLTHAEVLEAAEQSADRLLRVLETSCELLQDDEGQ